MHVTVRIHSLRHHIPMGIGIPAVTLRELFVHLNIIGRWQIIITIASTAIASSLDAIHGIGTQGRYRSLRITPYMKRGCFRRTVPGRRRRRRTVNDLLTLLLFRCSSIIAVIVITAVSIPTAAVVTGIRQRRSYIRIAIVRRRGGTTPPILDFGRSSYDHNRAVVVLIIIGGAMIRSKDGNRRHFVLFRHG